VKQVEYFRWWVTAPGRPRPYLTSFPMDAQEAAANYPGARPEPSTREVRQLPDTDAEQNEAMYQYQSAGHDSVKPPRN
jgi:thiamine pyrophosphate-dependent acetolactate synthase large subunit-like protein